MLEPGKDHELDQELDDIDIKKNSKILLLNCELVFFLSMSANSIRYLFTIKS